MSSHHEENHNTESKPISFTVPFIMACALLLIVFLFLSLCDPKHGHGCENKEACSKECAKACEKDDHSMHSKAEETEAAEAKESNSDIITVDSAKSEAPAEAKAEEAHH